MRGFLFLCFFAISVCKEPKNRKAREDIMLGATLAGIAFSNASAYSIPAAAERYTECTRSPGGLIVGAFEDESNDFGPVITEAHKECILSLITSAEDDGADVVGINVPLPVPVTYQSFGGWKLLLW